MIKEEIKSCLKADMLFGWTPNVHIPVPIEYINYF
jgi:hypothetical protein